MNDDQMNQVQSLRRALAQYATELESAQNKIYQYENSFFWRIAALVRTLLVIRVLRAIIRRANALVAKDTDSGDPRSDIRTEAEAEFETFMNGGEVMALDAPGDPEVSIILLSWNQPEFTLRCLKSISAEKLVRTEIIIVDNGSDLQTKKMLKLISGAKTIFNDTNEGFPRAVNQGASIARSSAILLLNNDATLRPGSLSAALRTLKSDDSVGAVGGRVVLPDGTLQEAGSSVFRDGKALQYMRGAAVDTCPAMYRRQVDYCSGCFLLIRKSAYQELGGLCEDFSPAYYEETDFCMRLREMGYRVIFEPEAIVDHFGSASSATRAHVNDLLNRNRLLFVERHSKILRHRYSGTGQYPPVERVNLAHLARSSAKVAESILLICEHIPLAPNETKRSEELERIINFHRSGCFVTVFSLSKCEYDWGTIYEGIPREVEVARDYDRTSFRTFMRERIGLYDRIVPLGRGSISLVTEIAGSSDPIAPYVSAIAEDLPVKVNTLTLQV